MLLFFIVISLNSIVSVKLFVEFYFPGSEKILLVPLDLRGNSFFFIIILVRIKEGNIQYLTLYYTPKDIAGYVLRSCIDTENKAQRL